MWKGFCGAMGRPDLVEDPRFATADARWNNRAVLEPMIEGWTRSHTKHEVMKVLGDAGVPCGACQDTGEVLADPHLKAREMIVDIDYPTRGVYQTVGCPVKMSESPAGISRPPLLGEHTDELLASLCGVDPDQLKRMREAGVV
jgi:formyl-CoA transferase